MAHQTGIMQYKGSFKSIRNYKNANDPRIFAGEKGGASHELILNNPAFARTRENMSEFKGCGTIVKAIRAGLQHLIPEHTDARFTGRLVTIIKMINLKDEEGGRGKRGIKISLNRPILKTLIFHETKKIDFQLKKCISASHSESRSEATIIVSGLNPDTKFVPGKAQYFRVINHVSIISDFAYSEDMRRYEPINAVDLMSTFVYSDYTPVNTSLSIELKTAFQERIVLTETDTVMQCVGIEFYIRSGADGYSPYSAGSMMIYDLF